MKKVDIQDVLLGGHPVKRLISQKLQGPPRMTVSKQVNWVVDNIFGDIELIIEIDLRQGEPEK